MLVVELAIVLVLIAFNGILALSELALVSARRSRLQAMAQRERRGAKSALSLSADPGRFLSSVQIGITLVGILAGAFSGATLGERLAGWATAQGLPAEVAQPASVALVVTIITYLSVVLGELVPKRLALRNPEPVACAVAPAMAVLARVASPVVWLLDISSRAVLTVLGARAPAEANVTEEEIKTLVAEAESAGVLEPEERAMIGAVMRLGDRRVRAVMTPRHEVEGVDITDDPQRICRQIADSTHSRLVAFEGPHREAVGIIQTKDVVDALMKGRPLEPRKLVCPAPVIPETVDALSVVAVLKQSSVHIGLVHDEYGHFEGVVTSADILEAIAGEFQSTEGPPDPDFVLREDGSYLISGSMPADELAERLGFGLPAGSYDTAAGLVLTTFERLPQVGEQVLFDGWRFEILDLDGRRIDKILATRAAGTTPASPASDAG